MPTIIESRPISITIGPVQMDGYLFVAAPPEETIVEGEITVLGFVQATIKMVATQQMMSVDLAIHEGIYTFSIHFDISSSSFLCQLQPKDAETEEEWHVLATLRA